MQSRARHFISDELRYVSLTFMIPHCARLAFPPAREISDCSRVVEENGEIERCTIGIRDESGTSAVGDRNHKLTPKINRNEK